MSAPKPRILVYGNCQGGWLSGVLAKQPEVASQYEVVYLSDYGGGHLPNIRSINPVSSVRFAW